MTDTPRSLSPAAQAVSAAIEASYEYGGLLDASCAARIAAAALRAATDATEQPQYNCSYVCDASELRAIANELDPHPQ
jgi:hypothetical protein